MSDKMFHITIFHSFNTYYYLRSFRKKGFVFNIYFGSLIYYIIYEGRFFSLNKNCMYRRTFHSTCAVLSFICTVKIADGNCAVKKSHWVSEWCLMVHNEVSSLTWIFHVWLQKNIGYGVSQGSVLGPERKSFRSIKFLPPYFPLYVLFMPSGWEDHSLYELIQFV